MYLDFYGFREPPFNITPDPRFLFFTARHREAYDHLLYGIEQRLGFMELTGEVGCGKTTLCRALLASLPRQVETALILNPALDATQMVRSILTDLGQAPVSGDHLSLVEQLNAYLLDRTRRGRNVAIFIDEAQDLNPGVIEQIRLLSNLETDQHKLMQLILAGQPELDRRLAAPDMRQVRQRIMVRCAIQALTREETGCYIRHRIRMAGPQAEASFEPRATDAVHKLSRGIPRLINKLCDRALLCGLAHGTRRITPREMRRARQELEGVL